MMKEITEKEWAEVKVHFDEVLERYLQLLGMPGVMVGPTLVMGFLPLLSRWNEGERSSELYEEMRTVE